MKLKIIDYLLLLIVFISVTEELFSQGKKLAQTGLKFLSVSTDARAAGMGEAVTAVGYSSASMFFNPSTMVQIKNNINFSFGTTKWIADINYIYGSFAFRPFDGDYGVVGISFVSVDYGEFQGTVFAETEAGYRDVGVFKPAAFAVGIAYAKELSEKFSVGGDVRYVKQSLGSSIIKIENGNDIYENNSINTVAYDFGLLYHTGFKSLDFGMSVRNFSTEIKYKEEGFQLPLNFKIGISMNVFDLIDIDRSMHSLLVSMDASHPRDYPEQIFIGGEYTFMNSFAVRAGYNFPKDEGGFSTGFGIIRNVVGISVGINYAYTNFGIFNSSNHLFSGFNGIHRLSVMFAY